MADTYENFEALRLAEPNAYAISSQPTGSSVVIVTPHGGGIEAGTSEIVKAIAGGDLSYYVFEGIKSSGNWTLHITSTRFDEPQGIALMQSSDIVLTIHGEESDGEVVYLGGRLVEARDLVRSRLEKFGYSVQEHADPMLQGTDQRNICNIGKAGAGIQLELSQGLRKTFFASLTREGRNSPTARFHEFCGIVRQVMSDIEAMK